MSEAMMEDATMNAPLNTRLKIALAIAIGVALTLGWNLARAHGAWEREAIERGYGELCFDGKRFAWKGEC